MTDTATCRIDGVVKTFGGARALDGVSFEVAGGIVGLLGPNGAGKTTLLRTLATVLAPDAGTVTLLGRDPRRTAARVAIRRRLGYMPQEPGFHRSFTAFDFVDYVAILKELTDSRAREAEVWRVLDLVGLTDRATTKIKHLSGGMRRRVALAQSLLREPELLVLDEPTAGLDPEQRLRLRDLLSRLGEDRTVVISTHQTEDVAALCDQVVVLHEGRVHFDGRPEGLAELARGQVWTSPQRDTRAAVTWRLGPDRYRHIGGAPDGADEIEPTIEDGYLLLVGDLAAIAQVEAA